MDKNILHQFINAINNYDNTDSCRENLKKYICYISEHKNDVDPSFPIDDLLHDASKKLKVYGYDLMNDITEEKIINKDDLSMSIDNAMLNYHKSIKSSDEDIIILDGMQKNIIDAYQQLDQKRIMVSAPTSFGKSYILQEILFNNEQEYRNIMFILPTIALLNENVNKYQEFIKNKKINYTIVSTNYEDFDSNARNLFIFTPERALKFLGKNILTIDFFFFDEVYKIEERLNITKDEQKNEDTVTSSDKRASAFRTCLYLLSKTVKDYYIAGPFLDFNKEECIGLKRFLIKNRVKVFEVNFDPTFRVTYDAWKTPSITENNSIYPEPRSYETRLFAKNQTGILNRVIKFIDDYDLGKTIIYLNYPSQITEIINGSNIFKNQPIKNKELELFITHLKTRYNVSMYGINSSEYWTLIKCLEFGIGIHHGKMPKYIQNEILNQFNEQDGLKYLFCTSTIIEGVNTKARNVVMLSNSYGSGEIKKFAFKNIKGRAGRYYKNFVGNLFYCSKEQKLTDDSNLMQLEFLNYSDQPLLTVDIDNTNKEDLSDKNYVIKEKRESQYNKELLPDSIFEQNRLFDRLKQEEILKKIISNDLFFEKTYQLTQKVIGHGIKFQELLGVALDLEEDVLLERKYKNKTEEEIKELINKYKLKIKYVVQNYETSGFTGLLSYQIKRNGQSKMIENMDTNYNKAFEEIRTIIEYEVPKFISLFQSLFYQACKLKNKRFGDNELDEFIKLFEIGSSNDFGRMLIERGFPTESAKIIDKKLKSLNLNFLNDFETIDYIDKNINILSDLDLYERCLYNKIINLYRKEI